MDGIMLMMSTHSYTNSRLLDKVCYLSRPESKDTDLLGNDIRVKHTFPYNPDSKTAPGTAQRWATRDKVVWDTKLKQYVPVSKVEPDFVERDNEAFGITIIDLDIRSEGGRAYKVIDEVGRAFDLREDQVLEVFKHVGVHPGGAVPGQFVWGILGSQMRMVLVGGDLHGEMVENAKILKAAAAAKTAGTSPKASSLKPGYIYKKRSGTSHMFIGRVRVPVEDGKQERLSFAFLQLPEQPSTLSEHYGDSISNRTDPWSQQLKENDATSRRWAHMSWEERCHWSWYDSREYYAKTHGSSNVDPSYYHAPADVVIVNSLPKFEEELPAVESDEAFATKIRNNLELKHSYVDGNSNDLSDGRAEEYLDPAFASIYNRGYGYGSSYGHRPFYQMSETEKAKLNAKLNQRRLDSRAKFKIALTWVFPGDVEASNADHAREATPESEAVSEAVGEATS